MPEPLTQLKRILMPTDLSEGARGALGHAASLARHYGAELHVLHVFTVHNYDPVLAGQDLRGLAAAIERLFGRIEPRLGRQVAETVGDNIQVRTAVTRAIAPYDGIVGYSKENDVDLIVIGSHGRSAVSYILLGSVALAVVRHAECPVLMVRQDGKKFVDADGRIRLRRILFPTDLSEHSRRAAPWALHLAQTHRAEIVMAHAVSFNTLVSYGMSGDQSMEEAAETIQRQAQARLREEASECFPERPNVEILIRTGPVGQTLADLAREQDVDLIVLSSHGRHGFSDHLLGSTAERLLRRAPCPVWVVR